MSDISNIAGSLGSTHRSQVPGRIEQDPIPAAAPIRRHDRTATDEVDISDDARRMAAARVQSELGVDTARIARVRQEIEAGRYDDPAKFAFAATALIDELAS